MVSKAKLESKINKLTARLDALENPFLRDALKQEALPDFDRMAPEDATNCDCDELEAWKKTHAQVVSDLIAARIQIEELKEKAAMYDGLCD